MKEVMSNEPVPRYLTQEELLIRSCDASQTGLGYVLFEAPAKAEYVCAQIQESLEIVFPKVPQLHAQSYIN